MEFSGDYSAVNSDGSLNRTPRQEAAKEFIKTHTDDYDFLVIFTNFDFGMPQAGARAYYLEVKNDTGGIGKALLDESSYYGSASKLQGIIEMGNLSNIESDPSKSAYDETILNMTHEFMHRWTASVKYGDSNGNVSEGLLGKDGEHWSYLLDTGGSIMYGNGWAENGDGSFTSVGSPKYLSPLDLYLMGVYDKSKVSRMLLIENPTIDKTKLPNAGDVVTGTAKYVTMDDIISAEGERSPDAWSSQREFKVGLILLVKPGTFSGTETAGIESIRNGFAGKIGELTFSDVSIQGVEPLMSVSIIEPSNGQTIKKPYVTVRGRIVNSTGNETGVTVNGMPATVYGNEFSANRVSLSEGDNTITVAATDTEGNTMSYSITVKAETTGEYITLTSNIDSGISPLEVSLRVDGTFSIDSSELTVEGPGVVEITVVDTDEYKVKMTVEGTYLITASATGPDGLTYQDTIAVTVLNRTYLDGLLKKKWEGMKTALSNADVEGAVNYFLDLYKETYRQAFTVIIDDLPQIVADMQDIEMIYLSDNFAKYRINREQEIDGTRQTIAYYVYFGKSSNGTWKVDKF